MNLNFVICISRQINEQEMRSRMQAPLHFVKSETIAKNYPTATIKNSKDELISIMQFVENLLPDTAIIICQRAKSPSVQYASANCKKVLGIDAPEVMKLLLPDFLTLVHPDDFDEVNQCFAFINALEPYDPLQYRFKLYYRIRHNKKQHFINIADEKMAIKNREGKNVFINSFRDITDEKELHDVKMDVYQQIQGNFKRTQTYIPRLKQSQLTPRQRDIVNLISKGFSNYEIAKELSVSVHTVKNHKTLLFRKVNVRNTLELMGATSMLLKRKGLQE